MSYEPTNWKDGDLVTSAKLNKMEQGIAAGGSGGITFVGQNAENEMALNKTWQEIYDAAQEGIVYIKTIMQDSSMSVIGFIPIINVAHAETTYSIMCENFDPKPTAMFFTAESPDDYPVIDTTNTDDTPHDTIQH